VTRVTFKKPGDTGDNCKNHHNILIINNKTVPGFAGDKFKIAGDTGTNFRGQP
jgi:hypothetical protein